MTAAPPAATPATEIPVGYYQLHLDTSLNDHLNRFCDGSPRMIADLAEIAPRIHDYRDYTREPTALAEAAYADERPEQAALYLRSAEFYLRADDPTKQPARRRFVDTMRQVHDITDDTSTPSTTTPAN